MPDVTVSVDLRNRIRVLKDESADYQSEADVIDAAIQYLEGDTTQGAGLVNSHYLTPITNS